MKYVGLFALLVLAVGCKHWQENKLIGSWQAAQVIEDDMPLELDVSSIGFKFFPTHIYNYTGTLNYKEAGTFEVRGDMLYTTDTINKASSEKVVKIVSLTEDSLFLKMNEEGKIRILKLSKVQ
jgi:hypothetical protein